MKYEMDPNCLRVCAMWRTPYSVRYWVEVCREDRVMLCVPGCASGSKAWNYMCAGADPLVLVKKEPN